MLAAPLSRPCRSSAQGDAGIPSSKTMIIKVLVRLAYMCLVRVMARCGRKTEGDEVLGHGQPSSSSQRKDGGAALEAGGG